MSIAGGWDFKINLKGMPQKVATGFSNLWNEESDFELEECAYLGEQVVNGMNHAVLARHALTTPPGGEKIVITILNDPPGDVDGSQMSLVEMKTILMGYDDNSGIDRIDIDIQPEMPYDFKEIYERALKDFTGSNIEPFQFVGTKRNEAGQLIATYIAKVTPNAASVDDAISTIDILYVNTTTFEIETKPVL